MVIGGHGCDGSGGRTYQTGTDEIDKNTIRAIDTRANVVVFHLTFSLITAQYDPELHWCLVTSRIGGETILTSMMALCCDCWWGG
jgi:hypothetical protein